MHSQENSSPALAHAAENVRSYRLQQGLSQDELAKRSGLSRRMINGLEAGSANISLSNLDAIGLALGVRFVDLVRPPQADNRDIRSLMWRGTGADSQAVLLGAAPAANMVELWHWSLHAGDRYDAQPDMQGFSEMIMVTEGALHIVFEHETKQLAAGEFAIFSSAQRYAYVNPGAAATRFIRNVIS
ncbi:helix-turn-helix domain-containing protein [Duganella sp. sic0402]|uniref:helix-turn-helix domain-containing protein n=1 Tax=Duganella sp. sic0402 TaxID=2854786 RepID=UPI001E34690A|nr:XRE family transcriptional regulator [Duganella sp. sic0402]